MHVPPFQLDKIIPARAFNQYYDARKYHPSDPVIMEGLIHFFHAGMQHVTSDGGMKLVSGHLEKDINWFNIELEKCGLKYWRIKASYIEQLCKLGILMKSSEVVMKFSIQTREYCKKRYSVGGESLIRIASTQ